MGTDFNLRTIQGSVCMINFLNIAQPFAADLLADAFVAMCGFPCYISTWSGFYLTSFVSYIRSNTWLRSCLDFTSLSQLSIDSMKVKVYWVHSNTDFNQLPNQNSHSFTWWDYGKREQKGFEGFGDPPE